MTVAAASATSPRWRVRRASRRSLSRHRHALTEMSSASYAGTTVDIRKKLTTSTSRRPRESADRRLGVAVDRPSEAIGLRRWPLSGLGRARGGRTVLAACGQATMAGRVRVVVLALMVGLAAASAGTARRRRARRRQCEGVPADDATTVRPAWRSFVADMQQVSTRARGGDLVGAEASVKACRGRARDIGGQLRQRRGERRRRPRSRRRSTTLATEFDALAGRSPP